MKTAAYTICKNEIKKIEQWFYYTKDFDYRVILDTGSTDGTYDRLKQIQEIDKNLILDQFILDDFRFDVVRNINLNMIPIDVDWCLSPDMDEYFSINVLKEIEFIQSNHPKATSIGCTRLDIYSEVVFVGPPKFIGTNKIHKRHFYDWKNPVYEFLSYIGPEQELEAFSNNIFLIHDQDINKPRSNLYFELMKKEYKVNPKNSWNSWFLANEYFKNQDLDNFASVAIDFCNNSIKDQKYFEVMSTLKNIYNSINIDDKIKDQIKTNIIRA